MTKSDKDDWKELRRVIAWIKCTIDVNKIIGTTDLSNIFTWIDAVWAMEMAICHPPYLLLYLDLDSSQGCFEIL